MSTLGTFAKFSSEANFARGKKKATTYTVDTSTPPSGMIEMKPAPKAATPAAKPTSMVQYPQGANLPMKSKQRMKGSRLEKLRGIKNRNIMIGSGLGLAGLGTLGAIAYNNRDSKKRADMSANTAFANFVSKDKKDAVKAMTQTGNADADAVIKKVRDETRKARRKELGNLKKQQGFESAADRGDVYKNAKGGEYINRTLAAAGSPERALIAQGKRSKNEFVQNIAKGAENIGGAGYKAGATGLRKVGNAIAGRTLTGKAVRLGAAGIGLSAIGGAMKRNRQENQ
jgi:hypothetical protein